MKNHMFYDPFIEHDKMQEKLLERDKRYRVTKTKFEIAGSSYGVEGESTLYLTVKKHGNIDVRISTYQDRKILRRYRCDQGHYHPIIARESHYFDLIYMTKEEALQLRDFLNERL